MFRKIINYNERRTFSAGIFKSLHIPEWVCRELEGQLLSDSKYVADIEDYLLELPKGKRSKLKKKIRKLNIYIEHYRLFNTFNDKAMRNGSALVQLNDELEILKFEEDAGNRVFEDIESLLRKGFEFSSAYIEKAVAYIYEQLQTIKDISLIKVDGKIKVSRVFKQTYIETMKNIFAGFKNEFPGLINTKKLEDKIEKFILALMAERGRVKNKGQLFIVRAFSTVSNYLHEEERLKAADKREQALIVQFSGQLKTAGEAYFGELLGQIGKAYKGRKHSEQLLRAFKELKAALVKRNSPELIKFMQAFHDSMLLFQNYQSLRKRKRKLQARIEQERQKLLGGLALKRLVMTVAGVIASDQSNPGYWKRKEHVSLQRAGTDIAGLPVKVPDGPVQPLFLEELRGWSDIVAEEKYRLSQKNGSSLIVSFAQNVLADLSDRKYQRYRQKFFNAVKKGLVGKRNEYGIKYLPSLSDLQQGIKCYEIKISHSKYRIFGYEIELNSNGKQIIYFETLDPKYESRYQSLKKRAARSSRN
jgi:hypothetical protein